MNVEEKLLNPQVESATPRLLAVRPVLFRLDSAPTLSKAYVGVTNFIESAFLDRAAIFAVLGNLASFVFGPITAFLIATHFSAHLQGFYYTIGSWIAFQTLLEFGLGPSIIQFVSHEWPHLQFDAHGRISGDGESLSRLASLARLAMSWYGAAAALVLTMVCPAGFLFFSGPHSQSVHWEGPWLIVCAGTAANLLLAPAFYFLQGCNRVAQFWFYRLIQQVLNGLSLWITILAGGELWSLSVAVTACVLWSVWYLARQPVGLLNLIFSCRPSGPILQWRGDIWPFQWRMGITWLSSYLTTSLFAPILFKVSGPVEAGQIGLTASLCGLVFALSCNWVVTKASTFGMLVAEKEYQYLDRLFFRSLCASMIVWCLSAVAIWLFMYVLNMTHHPLASRILPLFPTALLLLATAFNSAISALSIYLQAHKKEALASVSIFVILLTALFGVVFGKRYGATGIAAVYLAVIALIQFPLSLYIFWRKRLQWHAVRVDTIT